jgi:hypothetical protein
MPDSKRAYAAGAFAIEIDGKVAGLVSSVAGGNAFGIVAEDEQKVPTPGVTPKHLSNVSFRDITITCGIPKGALADWITAFLAGATDLRDGAIVFLDYTYKEIKRLEWSDGTITSISFPRLDAAIASAAALSVSIAVTRTELAEGSGTVLSTTKGGKAETWSASNFSLAIPGVDATKVATIEELTVSATLSRGKQPVLGPLELGDLVLAAARSGANSFDTWAQDSFLGNQAEKQATITYLGPNLKSPLMSLQLNGVGIFELAESKLVRSSESVPRITASMYVEQVTCLPAAEAPPAPAPAASAAATRIETDPGAVARRLLAASPSKSALDADSSRVTAGKEIGAAWARDTATLDELESVVTTADTAWTALSLADGHSLIVALQTAGVVPIEHDASLDLTRDPFVVGLVEGAAEVLGQVQPHLTAGDRTVEPPPD